MLYKSAFPKYERFPFWYIVKKSLKKQNEFYAIYDKEVFVGMLYTIAFKDIDYIMYFAINTNLRNGGYGSQVLKEWKEISKGKRLILNIEEIDEKASNFEERIRRKNFYLKNGYVNANVKSVERNFPFELLVLGEKVTTFEFYSLMEGWLGKTLCKFLLKMK